jgi:hypothetical protein
MKFILFAFLFVFACTFTKAQYTPLLNESSTWHGVTYGWGTFDFWNKIIGDSLINDQTYKKVYSGDTQDDLIYLIALMREDVAEQKVYIWTGTEEHMLYDFDVQIGETVSTLGLGAEEVRVITNVETIIVNGTSREKITFEDPWMTAYWIEGIGSIYGVQHGALGMVTDFSPVLTCFYEGNNLAWSNPDNTTDCDLFLGTTERLEESLRIFPNPASDFIQITLPFNYYSRNCQLKIMSSAGDLVYSEKLNTVGAMRIALPQLSAGLYQLVLSLDNQLISTGSVYIK